MNLRFRKTITLFPGVKITLSKSGVSTNIGIPGANVGIGKRGIYGNVGIPGTGLSGRTKLGDLGDVPEINVPPTDSAKIDLEPIAKFILGFALLFVGVIALAVLIASLIF